MTERWTVAPLPAEAIAVVRASAGRLVELVVRAIEAESSVYGGVLSGPEGTGIRIGIEQAIRAFLDGVERGEHPSGETGELWRRLGEAEFQAGRSLDALRSAFRIGTRAAWRGAADLAATAGIPTELVIALAEAIFVYTDELAAEVVEGYLRMQTDEAGELERRRRRLATLLLDPELKADPEVLPRASELASWPIPRLLAVLAVADQSAGQVARGLSVPTLIGGDAQGAYLVLPDPDAPGLGAELERTLEGHVAALGPAVAPRDAHRSLSWARLVLKLVQRGSLPAGRPARVERHLGQVILLQDEALAAELVRRRLLVLEDLPAAERDRLLETLGAWLAFQRHTPAIAQALHVHPQTVRYRIGKLRDLLGDALESAEGRFELELALRARRALDNRARAPGV
ncbi:MAG TPA: helix-turn-helix domain-containing protein [Solirubrobacteraceae bacterium]|jgi:hypothetical protein|nr:helix-turn-helix domain-containing protein [Solirubrobacteraceae bacterium]